jgi:hypothetical protein
MVKIGETVTTSVRGVTVCVGGWRCVVFVGVQVKDLLVEESNVQPVQAPVTVCGDIHGQFYDLLELFKVGEEVPATSYVFMVGHVRLALSSFSFVILCAERV